MANERTISVTGYGELHAKPDTVRLTLTIERTDADYAAAVRATEQCCAAVTDALVAAGVKLGDVLSVQNGGHGMPVVRAAAFRADSGAELEPEDMVLTDEVNAVFAIG